MYEDDEMFEGLREWEDEPIRPIDEEDPDGGVGGIVLVCPVCRFEFVVMEIGIYFPCPVCHSVCSRDNT